MFQLLVGEVGISRHEFYHDLRWWEVKAIIRGYNARHHHGWEQARLVAYNARFCMGSRNPIPIVTEWLKFPWEKEKKNEMTQQDRDELLAEIEAMNAALAAKQNE